MPHDAAIRVRYVAAMVLGAVLGWLVGAVFAALFNDDRRDS